MRRYLNDLIIQSIRAAQEGGDLPSFDVDDGGIERPADPNNGDFSSTVALRLARTARRAPRDIAALICQHLPQVPEVDRVEIAGPGFVNFYLTTQARMNVLERVHRERTNFAKLEQNPNNRVLVEFVSANPVGPMHVGHGRWAALGDSLCRILEHRGWDVCREFYINDFGVQMQCFGASLALRYQQLSDLVAQGMSLDQAVQTLQDDREHALDEGDAPYMQAFQERLEGKGYGGAYIIDMAAQYLQEDNGERGQMPWDDLVSQMRTRGYEQVMNRIKDTLEQARCHFDVYYSETSLYQSVNGAESPLQQVLNVLDQKGYIYQQDDATWFKSTDFGDDKDRVLVKQDGSYTYFAPDIAYHKTKLDRGYTHLINIWGADHHGYVKRMQSAIAALGHEGALRVLLGQLVNLLANGEPVRMSKRRGTMITFDELLEEVGVDATRYMLVAASTDQEINFDIEVAKKASAENPVYYVQYAHARICSILRKAGATQGLDVFDEMSEQQLDTLADQLIGTDVLLDRLTDDSEAALARHLEQFEDLLANAARDCAPFRLTHYATELAGLFHAFYSRCMVLCDDAELMRARLLMCDAARSVLALTLSLIGVSAPTRM